MCIILDRPPSYRLVTRVEMTKKIMFSLLIKSESQNLAMAYNTTHSD